MTAQRIPIRVSLICLSASYLLIPAFGQKVKVEFDPEADFSRIHQYQWRTHPAFEKNPQLLEMYSTAIQLVLDTGNTQLRNKGLQPADSSPDVFITFFLHAELGQTVTMVDSGPWWGPGWWYAPPAWITTQIDSHLNGSMLMDIVDAGSSKLLWRAYCTDKIDDMRTRDKNITAIVKKALKGFPPKQK